MRGSRFSMTVGVVIGGVALMAALQLGSLKWHLQRHQADLARAGEEFELRKAGCEAALADMGKFEKHLGTFLGEKEKETARLSGRIESMRGRIGDMEKIGQECEELDRELKEVWRILSLITGQAGGGR